MAKKENNFYYDCFAQGIAHANEAAALLLACFENYDPAKVQSSLEDMHDIEHAADGIKHEMMERLAKEFLPPIEREDIMELSHIIDDVTDSIEDLLRDMYMYNITAMRPEAMEFTNLIIRCCAALAEAAGELPNFRKSALLKEKLIEVNTLEEEGDHLFVASMRRLYTQEKDAIAIMSWTTIYKHLEKCCDVCEDVADIIEQIIMKNS